MSHLSPNRPDVKSFAGLGQPLDFAEQVGYCAAMPESKWSKAKRFLTADIEEETGRKKPAAKKVGGSYWCKHCHKEVSPEAKACPHCGQPDPATDKEHWTTATQGCMWALVGLGLLALAALFGYYLLTGRCL